MFNLLLMESYRDDRNDDIKLKDKEISMLLTIISKWIEYCGLQFKHLIREKPVYEKIL